MAIAIDTFFQDECMHITTIPIDVDAPFQF